MRRFTNVCVLVYNYTVVKINMRWSTGTLLLAAIQDLEEA